MFRHDQRQILLENSLQSPASTQPQTTTTITTTTTSSSSALPQCPTVATTFVNEKSCVRQPACAPLQFSTKLFQLNSSTLKEWYTRSSRHLLYISGLRVKGQESPCDSGTSRWQRRPRSKCNKNPGLSSKAHKAIVSALRDGDGRDSNPYARDIQLNGGLDCGGDDEEGGGIGATVLVDNTCWQHCHPDLYNVYDFSFWTIKHPGNTVAAAGGRPNPIAKSV
jgi:hypothetical protein